MCSGGLKSKEFLLEVTGESIKAMMRMFLGTFGMTMGIFGLFTNLYILLILVLHKKTRSSSEWILLHLSSSGIGSSFCSIFFSSPSIIWDNWLSARFPFCDLVGGFVLVNQFITVWTICALSADRCAAIVSPLRYTQVVTLKRVGVYFVTVWTLSLLIVILAFSFSTNMVHNHPNNSLDTIQSLQHSIPSENPTFSDLDYIPTPTFLIPDQDIPPRPLLHDPTFTTTKSGSDQIIEVMDLTFRLDDGWEGERVSMDSPGGAEESQSVLITPAGEGHFPSPPPTDPLVFEFRPALGLCLPRVHQLAWQSLAWTCVWILLILIGPMSTVLICDLTVLSIARRQRHRIVMALYQITLSAQATVTRSKGTAPTSLWMNRAVPAKSRACRAVWEDLGSLLILNCPLIVITVTETLTAGDSSLPPELFLSVGSLALFLVPLYNALLYGVRARPIRATVRSYMRKRLTNSTLQQEIQQRLSPVDGSPRPASRAKSFRSSSPSPNSSISETPRRLSTNDLRPPPPIDFFLPNSPSHGNLGRSAHGRHQENRISLKARKVRSFLHIPTHYDVHEFWSGLRKPQRSPTIIITHEIRLKGSANSLVSSSSSPFTNAEHML